MPRENTIPALKLLGWSKNHGRKNLPWQRSSQAYRIWLSEIMLQQTQVSTVIDYFERFTLRFPTITSLAAASVDEVLALWSGLGYYARARNLHKAAIIIARDHDGVFPDNFDDVLALPGIGKSTAGAILAFSQGQRHPILDGNVKRVLCRYYGIEGYPGKRDIELQLWKLADHNTPETDVPQYTQAIMDLGATVCTRTRPACPDCPLSASCTAKKLGIQALIPTPKPGKTRPTRHTTMLVINDHRSRVLLQKRPPTGIWGGLWSLPECPVDTDIKQHCRKRLGLSVSSGSPLARLKHSFTHYHLMIQPHRLNVSARGSLKQGTLKEDSLNWFEPGQFDQLGMPKPVKSLLDTMNLKMETEND